MAKKSIIAREHKRERTVRHYATRRAELKATIKNPLSSDQERWAAQVQLQKMPRNASPVRLQNRCQVTGRARGYFRKFGLSRNMLRKYACKGQVPGLVKASW